MKYRYWYSSLKLFNEQFAFKSGQPVSTSVCGTKYTSKKSKKRRLKKSMMNDSSDDEFFASTKKLSSGEMDSDEPARKKQKLEPNPPQWCFIL